MTTQTVRTISSRKFGPVTYIRTTGSFRTTRVLRTGTLAKNYSDAPGGSRVLRSQSTISRTRYAAFHAKGGFFRAGDSTRLVWVS